MPPPTPKKRPALIVDDDAWFEPYPSRTAAPAPVPARGSVPPPALAGARPLPSVFTVLDRKLVPASPAAAGPTSHAPPAPEAAGPTCVPSVILAEDLDCVPQPIHDSLPEPLPPTPPAPSSRRAPTAPFTADERAFFAAGDDLATQPDMLDTFDDLDETTPDAAAQSLPRLWGRLTSRWSS